MSKFELIEKVTIKRSIIVEADSIDEVEENYQNGDYDEELEQEYFDGQYDNVDYKIKKVRDSKFKDAESSDIKVVKDYIYDYIDQWFNNDFDEETEMYGDAFKKIQTNDKLLTKVATELKDKLVEEELDLDKLEDTYDTNYYTYEILKKFARR